MTTACDALGTLSIFRFSTYENVLNFLTNQNTYKMTCDSKINLYIQLYIYIYIYTTSEKPVNDQSYGVLDRYGITIIYK